MIWSIAFLLLGAAIGALGVALVVANKVSELEHALDEARAQRG